MTTILDTSPIVNNKLTSAPWLSSDTWGPENLRTGFAQMDISGQADKVGRLGNNWICSSDSLFPTCYDMAALINDQDFENLDLEDLEEFRKARQERHSKRETVSQLAWRWYKIGKAKLRDNAYISDDLVKRYQKLGKIQTKNCGKREIPKKQRADNSDHVEIGINEGKAHWRKVQKCHNSRYCAVCADSRQAAEFHNLENLKNLCKEKGWTRLMITLTMPHTKAITLSNLLQNFSKGLSRLFSGEAWKTFKVNNDYIGMVRSEEILYGKNGWHPHQHIILVVGKPEAEIDKYGIEQYFQRNWIGLGEEFGWVDINDGEYLSKFYEHGVDFLYEESDHKISEKYFTKSLDYEMTSSTTKNSKVKSETIWGIIQKATKEAAYENLLQEFILAVWGRPAFRWSPGLKDYLDIVEELPASGKAIYAMPAYYFKRLVKNEGTLQILEVIESGNQQEIDYYIDNYRLTPAKEPPEPPSGQPPGP